jgi:putative transposase
MPAKNVIKLYVENGWYHLYNRGIEKRDIFLDEQDYKVFLHYFKRYLTQSSDLVDEIKPRFKNDLFDKIQLVSYCLMPNHFHLLVKQAEKNTIIDFMRALSNSYTHYFNQKYQRIGPLFQGAYKGILINEEPYLLHLSRYIHLNPLEIYNPAESGEVKPRTRFHLVDYPYSSYGEYLGLRKTEWIHPDEILSFFKTAQRTSLRDCLSRLPSPGGEATGRQAYQSFVEDYEQDPREIIGTFAID